MKKQLQINKFMADKARRLFHPRHKPTERRKTAIMVDCHECEYGERS
jgi:hypothetical protein